MEWRLGEKDNEGWCAFGAPPLLVLNDELATSSSTLIRAGPERPPAAETYQILARNASGRTIGSPSLHPHAALNSGMFDSGPFTRHLLGACASVLTC